MKAEKYIDNLRSNGKSRSYIVNAQTCVKKYRELTGHDPEKATDKTVNQFIQALKKANPEQRGRRYALQLVQELSRIVEYYGRATAIRRLKEIDARRMLGVEATGRMTEDWSLKALDHDQLKKIISTINTVKNPAWTRPIVLLAIGTGCRVSEIITLRFKDVIENGAALRVTGKGNKTRIVEIIMPEARAALADYIKLRMENDPHGHDWKPKPTENDCIFKSSHHRSPHVSARAVQIKLNEILDRLGINEHGRCIHSLRHSFATEWIDANGDLLSLSNQLGHAQLTTTQHYTHIRQERIRQEGAAVAKTMFC